MKGIYCLIINIKENTQQKIGSLTLINFKKGIYVYVGSAQNNLGKRIKRHLSNNKKLRWHIDYLLSNPNVKIKTILYKIATKEEECLTALSLLKTETPIKHFGCSDCKCFSHLFKIKSVNNLNKLNLLEFNAT